MDLGTAIIGAICVIICALPFVLIGINRKRKEKEILATLNNAAHNNHCQITQHEICGYYAIGIDEQKKTLFFATVINDVHNVQVVELLSVIDCKIAKVKRSTKGGKIVQRLLLQLNYVEPMKQGDVLEFYNADVSYQLSNEIQSIEKWNNIVNSVLVNID